MDITTLFFQLLQVAVGTRESLSRVPSASEWGELYALAEKHSVVGVCWGGIERLPKNQNPPMDLLMEWLGQAEYIKTQNEAVNSAIAEVCSKFQVQGFKGVVLKGQGLAQLYPQPELRTSGDIDYLIKDADINKVVALARQNNPGYLHVTYHHCDFGKIKDVEVEAHWRASWFYTPWYNKSFQAFCQQNLDENPDQNALEYLAYGGDINEDRRKAPRNPAENPTKNPNKIPTPSLAFNRVFVLVHIYRHLFTEGIGLRQILDYYFVLKSSVENPCENRTENIRDDILEGTSLRSSKSTQNLCKNPFWPQEKIETMQRLKELGMQRFTAAIMWVLQQVFEPAVSEFQVSRVSGNTSNKNQEAASWMLCEPNEKDGKFLLSEIMQSGNFGKHDKRYVRQEGEAFLHYAFRKIIRNFRLFKFGPWEVICTPFWRLWHICWWMPRHNR